MTRSPRIDLGGDDEYRIVADVPPVANPNLDVLFVVDNSGWMGAEQLQLVEQAPAAFFDPLVGELGEIYSLNVGVVSSNVGVGGYQITGCGGDGDDGRLLNQARYQCMPPSGYYIQEMSTPGGYIRDFTGTIGEAFSCIALLGIDGCGFEQPLESMKRAVDGSNPQNAGFIRNDALLLIVILSDEDDCSASDPAMFDPAQTEIDSVLGPLSSFRCFEFGVACDDDQPRLPGLRTQCVARETPMYMTPVAETRRHRPGRGRD